MTTLADTLKDSIERWAAELRDSSALAQLTRAGGLTPRALALYLTSLRYLFASSQRHLALAAARSEELGHAALADYFRDKVQEEQGHDAWASDDLAQLPEAASRDLDPSEHILELVDLQRRLIERHPACFVVYVLWAEYFTVLVGDAWLDALETCGYERAQVSAVTKHLDADREHAARGFDAVDRLWDGLPERAVMLAVVTEAARVFDAFCDDICARAQRAA